MTLLRVSSRRWNYCKSSITKFVQLQTLVTTFVTTSFLKSIRMFQKVAKWAHGSCHHFATFWKLSKWEKPEENLKNWSEVYGKKNHTWNLFLKQFYGFLCELWIYPNFLVNIDISINTWAYPNLLVNVYKIPERSSKITYLLKV